MFVQGHSVSNYHMKVNKNKSNLLFAENAQLTSSFDKLDYVRKDYDQMLLGATIGSTLSFEEHINNRTTLARIACYINIQKRRTIMK